MGKTRGNILSGKDNHVYKYLSSVSLLFDFEAIVYKIYLAKYNSYIFLVVSLLQLDKVQQ